MKALKWMLLIIAAMALSASVAWAHWIAPNRTIAAPAPAGPAPWHGASLSFGHEHQGRHHHRHSGGVIIFAPALFAPAPVFDDPRYPFPPAPAIGESPPVYIERADAGPGGDTAAATPGGVWYFCEGTGTYYPYVTECPGGWKVVPQRQ